MLDLCCHEAFSPAVACRLLVAVASPLVSEHRIWGAQASVAAVREFPSERGLSTCDAQACRLRGMWGPPSSGTKPGPPASQVDS